MSKSQNFNNIFSDLAESAYNVKSNSFVYSKLSEKKQKALDSGESVRFNFSKSDHGVSGGQNLPNEGKVYLQPDLKEHVKTAESVAPFGGMAEVSKNVDVMKDEMTGYNSYFVTDHKKIADTKEAYLSVRGSDNFHKIGSAATDWVENDANFAIFNSIIPQADNTETTMKAALEKLPQGATLNVTGHSLGTMASAQGTALLARDNPSMFDRIGKVVLFNGPDITESLRNAGFSDKQIEKIGSKITYYVNPLDAVSMLNRMEPLNQQLGHVNYIIPMDFSTSPLDQHGFGEFQIGDDGQPLVASKNFHPEMLEAGKKLAQLEIDTVKDITETLKVGSKVAMVMMGMLTSGASIDEIANACNLSKAQVKKIKDDLTTKREAIMNEARIKAEKWDAKAIPDLQKRIQSASGSKKVQLREELIETVAQEAVLKSEDFAKNVTRIMNETAKELQNLIKDAQQTAHASVIALSHNQVDAMMSEINFNKMWNFDTETATAKSVNMYKNDLKDFSTDLLKVATNIKTVDQESAIQFKNEFLK